MATTPDEIVARAAAIAPTLVARQAETEQRTCYAPDTHEHFREAGFYRMLVPRRYGGHELDVPTFVRGIAHLARGCPSTAWQVCLPTAHALLVAAWFDERAQDGLFTDPDFLCPSVAAPVGTARSTGDGFLELTGTHRYCSGAPYATHYLGQTLPAAGGPPTLFVAPRSEWTMLDDWGHTLGLKGSGSNSILFDGGRIPEYFALADTQMLQVDNSGGTPGQRLHGNPMYLGRALSFFGLEFIALAVGMVKGALDEYAELITTRTTHRPPIVLRSHDADYQRWYGHARAKVDTAEAAMLSAADQWMEACRRQVQEGVPFDVEEDLRIQSITRESVRLCWDGLQEYVFRTAGSSAAHDGERIQRIWRDMSMVWGHLASVIGDWAARGMATEHFGIEPRAPGPATSDRARCTLVMQVAKKATNSLDGVGGLAVQVNRVAAPVREQVFDQLRQAIVEMRLKPEQRLVERELIEQTGVSRTTIREVLRQLAAEGLVTTIPHKGTVVAAPSVERAAELYEVRAMLEGMAARQFAERATDVHLRALRRAFEGIERRARLGRPNSQAMLEAKRHFYDALFEGAANGTIQSLVESLQARVTVLRAASLSQPGRAAQTVEEVRAIVEALERRDGDAAAAACVHHVNEAARTVFEAMAAAEAEV